jgi:phosphoribosyl 1,2-cyclic phosphodiesterase
MAVSLTVLASGSKGNCSVLSNGTTSILVDAGLSCRETYKRMAIAGINPDDISAIVITHEHSDHITGLSLLTRKLDVPVYMTGATRAAYDKWARAQARVKDQPPKTYIQKFETFESGKSFTICGIDAFPFTIPHDAEDPVGFVFRLEGVQVGIVTDLGYLPENVKLHLRGCDGLMIESNHDLEMLRNGPYPWALKQRVMSRVGHLSNESLAEFLSGEYDGAAAFLVLAHLSENNNHPDLARGAAENALTAKNTGALLNMPLLAHPLRLARQDAPLETITL